MDMGGLPQRVEQMPKELDPSLSAALYQAVSIVAASCQGAQLLSKALGFLKLGGHVSNDGDQSDDLALLQ
jgi:hypothetical protein